MDSPCLGSDTRSVSLFLVYCITCILFSFHAYSARYYEPKSHRYITVEDEPAEIKNIRAQMRNTNAKKAIPSALEIKRQEALRMQENQAKPLPNNNTTQAYRKFDPNRYHKTEQISFF